jgi:hypothetical protein
MYHPDFFKAFGVRNFPIEYIKQIPRDVIIQPWLYWPVDDVPYLYQLRAMDFEYIPLSSVANYATLFPQSFDALANIWTLTRAAVNAKSLGAWTSSWGCMNLHETLWPGIAFQAECAWNIDKANPKTFMKTFLARTHGAVDDRLVQIYKTLSSMDKMLPTVNWLEGSSWSNWTRHPASTRIDGEVKKKVLELGKALGKHLEGLREIKLKDKDSIRLLDYHLRAALVTTRIILACDELAQLQPNSSQEKRNKLAAQLEEIATGLESLLMEFSELWVSLNRPKGLEEHHAKPARMQSQAFRKKSKDLRGN